MNSLSYENSVLKENESTTSLKKDLRNINLNYANKIYSNFDNIEQDDCNVSYVENNDFENFQKGVTANAQPYAEEMFKKLQGIMGVDAVEEGKSPHKKGTKKYKKHMAAMHANM